MRSQIAIHGIAAFSDYDQITKLADTNRRIYESAKKVAGTLLFGYDDKTAKLQQTVTKGEVALFLTRNYGIDTKNDGGKEAMQILGLSGDANAKVDTRELTKVIQNWVAKNGTGKFDLQIVQDALAGKLSGSLTRGEAIMLAEKPTTTGTTAATTTSSTSKGSSNISNSGGSNRYLTQPKPSTSGNPNSSSSGSPSSSTVITGSQKDVKLIQ